MALKIQSAPSDPAAVADRIRRAIEAELAGARAEVRTAGPGHFEVRVVWSGFAGQSKLQQHQSVYRAITPLLSGDSAPVHAIDRLDCRLA
jgi:acid stress-induced BolA-like protein IbaG/YrbA